MQSLRDLLLAIAAQERDTLLNSPSFTPLPEVGPGCRLKFGDEVEVYGMTALYLLPSDYPGWFYGLTLDGNTVITGTHDAAAITNRIPADPEETPMPIFESAP